jgi:hypothetical protein
VVLELVKSHGLVLIFLLMDGTSLRAVAIERSCVARIEVASPSWIVLYSTWKEERCSVKRHTAKQMMRALSVGLKLSSEGGLSVEPERCPLIASGTIWGFVRSKNANGIIRFDCEHKMSNPGIFLMSFTLPLISVCLVSL